MQGRAFLFLHLGDDAGCRADEQPGGAGDPVCGNRPAPHPGNAEGDRATLQRTDLDRLSDLHTARPVGQAVSGSGGVGILP